MFTPIRPYSLIYHPLKHRLAPDFKWGGQLSYRVVAAIVGVEGVYDLSKLASEVGAQRRLWRKAFCGIADEHPADLHDGMPPYWQTAEPEAI